MGGGVEVTRTLAAADCVGSWTETAVIVTVGSAGGAAGAVKSPVAEIVPTTALPPTTPFTDQATAAFVALERLATKL